MVSTLSKGSQKIGGMANREDFDTRGATPMIDDDRVEFVNGWFINFVPPFARDFADGNKLVLHLDADLYKVPRRCHSFVSIGS